MEAPKYFMWEFQSHFRALAEMAAKSLFGELDSTLRPRIALIGLLQSHRIDHHPLCVEPEDGGFEPRQFSELLQAHESMGRLVVSNVYPRARSELRRQHDYLTKTLLKCVDELGPSQKNVLFCSRPATVDQYLVFTVLQLDRSSYDDHFRLRRKLNDESTIHSASLVDAAIEEFLDECTRLLSRPDPVHDRGTFRSSGEVLRAAGRSLMDVPKAIAGNIRGDFFRSCATIASLKYEGQEGEGRLIVAEANHPDIELDLSLQTPVPLRSYRAVRKLLQLTSADLSLVSDTEKIVGIGRIKKGHERSDKDLFVITFIQLHVWDLSHSEQILMRVSYGEPRLAKTKFHETKFRKDLPRIFPEISVEGIDRLTEIATVAVEQKHGTMLVITPEAASEAERLDKQCTRIQPTRLTPEVLQTATEIDGAVLLGIDGTCYAIGVILDGRASQHGTPARGARFNSAVRYIDSNEHPCLALVISEDGTVDLVPDLMPHDQLPVLMESLAALRAIAQAKNIEQKKFHQLMDWFDSHRFYLGPEICAELNSLQAEIQKRLPPQSIKIVYPEFISDGGVHE